jgi:Legume lectin domain
MKPGITKFIMLAAIAALLFVTASTAASAQAPSCPTSPAFTPDFSLNQTCLTLNNNGAVAGYPGFYAPVLPAPSGVTQVLRLTPNQFFTAGSAWYGSQQPVAGAFSTTFTFQLTGTSQGGSGNADGIAFVIQNSAVTALGPDGCGIGFGSDSLIDCTSGSGITNSLAIEFNTFLNAGVDTSANSVWIQNCSGTGANSVDPGCTVLTGANNNLPITLADGNVHTVTINYSGPTTKLLDVIVDNNDLFPGGVFFDLTTIGLNSGNAWVGFTGATGGGDDNQDILSWTFTPQTQSVVVTSNTQATVPFQNAAQANVYDYTAQLSNGAQTVQIKPILMTQSACNAIVQKSFWPAHCFVYENAENSGMDAAVMFEVTCPQSSTGTCSSTSFQELGTDFEFLQSENPLFVYPGVLGLLNPFPGWLKGDGGPDPLHPCTPPTSGALFQSNQIDLFFIDGGTTKGKSAGGASCWVATYDTPGEALPGIRIASPTVTTYTQNQVVTASYTCSDPSTSQPGTSLTGPYLTAASCTQSELLRSGFNTNSCTSSPGQISCTGPVDTTTTGLHTLVVTAIDSGGNTNVQLVIYNVKKK